MWRFYLYFRVHLSTHKVTNSEPHPSLKLGENIVQECYIFQNLSLKLWNRQGILLLPNTNFLTIELFYGVIAPKNISKARTELGFDPRSPETAIREAFDYLESRSKK